VPFGVTVRELVGKRGLSLLGCHIMNDESVVFGLSQKTLNSVKPPTGCAVWAWLIWPLGAAGGMVGKLLPARKPSDWMRYSRHFAGASGSGI
jgi:predicted branched-subunit amino acid permease